MFAPKPLIVLFATGIALGMSKPFVGDYSDPSSQFEDLGESDTPQNRPARQWSASPAFATRPDNIFFPRPVGASNNRPLTSQPTNFGNNPDFGEFLGNGGNTNFGDIFGNGGNSNQNQQNPARPPGGSSGCSCVSTEEYNPVCGSDNNTYSNPSKLICAQRCGQQISQNHFGVCRVQEMGRG